MTTESRTSNQMCIHGKGIVERCTDCETLVAVGKGSGFTPMPDIWRCFHCDEVFTDREKARLHFGDEIDAEPGCAVSLRKYREMEAEICRLRRDIEAETTSSRAFYSRLSLLLKSYRPFRQCSDLQDVFNVYDSMEGRALAAEEKLQERAA